MHVHVVQRAFSFWREERQFHFQQPALQHWNATVLSNLDLHPRLSHSPGEYHLQRFFTLVRSVTGDRWVKIISFISASIPYSGPGCQMIKTN